MQHRSAPAGPRDCDFTPIQASAIRDVPVVGVVVIVVIIFITVFTQASLYATSLYAAVIHHVAILPAPFIGDASIVGTVANAAATTAQQRRMRICTKWLRTPLPPSFIPTFALALTLSHSPSLSPHSLPKRARTQTHAYDCTKKTSTPL